MSYNLLVLGAGSGGLAAAKRAAAHGAKVALIEGSALGGTCVNVGCVPKKLMWEAGNFYNTLNYSSAFGVDIQGKSFDWAELKRRRDKHVLKINGRYDESLANLGIDVIRGWGKFLENKVIQIDNDKVFKADHILIATGSQSIMPEIPGIEHAIDSDGFFELPSLPSRSLVLGNGYIAAELAGVLHALGSNITQAIRKDVYCGSVFDHETATYVAQESVRHGLDLRYNHQSTKITANGNHKTVHFENGESITANKVIMAVGRAPLISGIGLENTDVQVAKGAIKVDEFQNTSASGVYSIGDVTGRDMLTPVAIATGKALSERVFNNRPDSKMDFTNIPTVMFTHPPLGTVGLSEEQAVQEYGADGLTIFRDKTMDFHYSMRDSDEDKTATFCKLIIRNSDDKVIGFHVAGRGADEMTQGFAIAMKMGATKFDLDRTVAIHPTVSEQFVLLQ